MQYRHHYVHEPRLTLASLVLLIIFVSAVAFGAAAIAWQPWDESESTRAQGTDAAIEAPDTGATDGGFDVLIQPAPE